MPTTNNNFDWLTYESVFNKPDFRKSNKKYELGLYLIPRNKVTVWFRNDIDEELLTKLTDAFFPDFDRDKHLKTSNSIWPWKEIVDAGTIEEAISPVGVMANRGVNVLNLPPYVVLPYNYYDNNAGSRALGTLQSSGEGLIQLKSAHKWEFWKTASRSNVVRLSRINGKGEDWTLKKQVPWVDWNFAAGDPDRVNPANLLQPAEEPTRYQLTTLTKNDVSLKTGVIFVGSANQKGSNKDFLDDNWIVAGLRSDYVTAINKEMEGRRHVDSKKQDIVILTELLSINETAKRVEGKYKDGVQVRDISLLNKDNIYLAPLNIPFVNLEFNLFQEEFACLDDKDWCDYWKKHWATSLGTAKALFLLRYGLQHINPNVQNYMIEFKKGRGGKPEPTGKIIIRDLQDASLHREVVWALYGPDEPPPVGEDQNVKLQDLRLEVLKYEFREVEYYQETGSTDKQFGPPGTQFLWQRFSSFGNGDKILKYKEVEPFKSKWKVLLATMADWGRAHNRAYVGCVEHQLGLNFTEIKWDEIQDPERYRTLDNIDRASSECTRTSYTSSPPVGGDAPVIDSIGGGNFPSFTRPKPKANELAENMRSPFETKFGIDKSRLSFVVGFMDACLIVKGENFKHIKVEIGDVAIDDFVISADGKEIYLKPDIETRNKVVRFEESVTLTNYSEAGKINSIGSVTCEPKQSGDMGWEENAAKVIHDYLRSPEGQTAIRDYKARGWQPVKPTFQLQVLEKNKPIENAFIRIYRKDTDKIWTDITDSDGKVHIYQGETKNYTFSVKGYRDLESGSFEVKDVENLGSQTLDFDYVTIKFLAG